MLIQLQLKNLGPSDVDLVFGERLNLITGDNGLGKSFLLDAAWWSMTRKWPAEINARLTSGKKAIPRHSGEATIGFKFTGRTKEETYTSTYQRRDQAWTGRAGRPANPGMVLYAMADGSFSVWDPARNYWRTQSDIDVQERIPAYVFSPTEVWDGLPGESGSWLCNGLIRDWAAWQDKGGPAFTNLCKAFEVLSPSDDERLVPGALTRIDLDDARDMPTLKMPYGDEVPVVHASSGMRRIIALAYLLIWCWDEHQKASELLDEPTTNQVVLLIDEVESHLHPKWQRRIVPALLQVMEALVAGAQVQLLGVTHSPLVMASVEPEFKPETDAWFDMDIEGAAGHPEVTVREREFVRRGDAAAWLMSPAFDMASSRSLKAERLIEEAGQLLSADPVDAGRAKDLDARLRTVLGDVDPFWIRWRFIGEKQGWLP